MTSTVKAYMIVLRISILQLLCLLFFVGSVSHIYAMPVTTESFMLSNQKSDWYEVNYPSTESNFWEFDQSALTATIDRGSRRSMLIPHHHQFPVDWPENWSEFTFHFDFLHTQGADVNFLFNYRDELNWYEVHIKYGTYQIVRVQNGNSSFRVFGTIELEKDVWQQIQIKISNDEYSLYLNNRLIGVHTDWTYNKDSPGIVGLRATTGAIFPSQVSFRNIGVRHSSKKINTLPHFKQTDPTWAKDEYDSAQLWSTEPTMYRWGCLTTSMAMIFQYYGVPVTPQTLNDWLKTQPDGYIGNGLFNWIAATRLARLYNQELGTPKLEYTVVPGSDLQPAQQELTANRPVIYQLPGHFLVGASPQTIYDPFYDFKSLDEHTVYQEKGLLSTRILTPSNTDLSYFMFIHSPNVELKLQDENQKILPLVTTQDWLSPPPNHTEFSTDQLVSLFAKPPSGNYEISVTSKIPTKEKIEILTYDSNANPTQELFNTWVSTQKTIILIQFEKEVDSEGTLPDVQNASESTIHIFMPVQRVLESILLFENQTVPWHAHLFLRYLHIALTFPNLTDLARVQLSQKILTLFASCLPPEFTDFWSMQLKFALDSLTHSTSQAIE